MNSEYDIAKAFQRIEEKLIKSMKTNLTRHLNEENDLNMNWSAWQTEQLKSLEQFKKKNKDLFKKDFSNINNKVEELIKKSYENGQLDQEKIILEAIQSGKFSSSDKQINKMWNIYNTSKNQRIKKKQLTRIYETVNQAEAGFFKVNERKLNALINETMENFNKAEMSILRYSNDQYRKTIYDAQVYANTGSGTIQQAVDMATKDFLAKGINSIKYSNGAMVNIASYAEMAIRTANKRAYLQGEGTKRQEWGVHTVLVPNRGGGCPYCIKFQGKIFIDDVWSGGTEEESKKTRYPLLSTAIEAKLFHPNCKDTTVTYFPGITTKPIPPTEEELRVKEENYKNEQKMKYIDRNIDKYSRLELGSIDPENIKKYHNKRLQWQEYKKQFKENRNIFFKDIEKGDILLTNDEQYAINQYISSESYKINDKLRNKINLNVEEENLKKNLDLALDKCNNYEGNIVRVLDIQDKMKLKEFLQYNEIGTEPIFSEYLSFSNKNEYNSEANIFIYTNSKTAKDLRKYNPEESELLYKRNSRFLVENVIEKDGKYYILWRDINE